MEDSPYLWCKVYDAALLMPIEYDMQDLVEQLGPRDRGYCFSYLNEPIYRFWEEDEYDVLGKSMFLTASEWAAVQIGNVQILQAVYDRNTVANKPFPWDQWSEYSKGRQCWHRTLEDWKLLKKFTAELRNKRQEPEAALEHIRATIEAIAVFK